MTDTKHTPTKVTETMKLKITKDGWLDPSIEYLIHSRRKVLFHPDLGWGIYIKYGKGESWDREADLTSKEAMEEVLL